MAMILKNKRVIAAALVAATAIGLALPAFAQKAAAPAPPAPTPAGWNELIEAWRALPAQMLARLPEDQRDDPQVQQEVARLALEAVASTSIDAIGGDGDHPAFLAQVNSILNVGQPNADTGYRLARITPGGTYRLRGTKGSLRIFTIAEGPPSPFEPGFTPPKPGVNRPVHDFNALKPDAQGRYDVILSPTRPKGYTGDWWPLQPETNKLLMRQVNADWGKEAEPTVAIERLDTPAPRPRPSAALLEQRLRTLPAATKFIAALFVDHVEKLRAEGFINKLKVFDVSAMGGLAGQFYYEGAYDLKDDEALIVEATVPKTCKYRSLILTNRIYETTDWYNNHSSLNDAQAKPDADGVLRIVVSARDPGVPNWLDTAGYPVGIIQGRWFECDTQPVPSARKVALADVRKSLPAATPTVTPAERDRIVRDRRAALQHRPLW
jgi:hypothetical protein